MPGFSAVTSLHTSEVQLYHLYDILIVISSIYFGASVAKPLRG